MSGQGLLDNAVDLGGVYSLLPFFKDLTRLGQNLVYVLA
jgi:hypothetical protein